MNVREIMSITSNHVARNLFLRDLISKLKLLVGAYVNIDKG